MILLKKNTLLLLMLLLLNFVLSKSPLSLVTILLKVIKEKMLVIPFQVTGMLILA